MTLTLKRYKKDYDENVLHVPQKCVGDEVYIDCTQHGACPFDSSKRYAQEEYKKLMQRTCRPYKVTEIQSYTIVINQDCILN